MFDQLQQLGHVDQVAQLHKPNNQVLSIASALEAPPAARPGPCAVAVDLNSIVSCRPLFYKVRMPFAEVAPRGERGVSSSSRRTGAEARSAQPQGHRPPG